MASRETSSKSLLRIIKAHRAIVLAVQVTPFAYGLFYIAAILIQSDVMAAVFYASPLFVVAELAYSRILRLCKWHRKACAVPLFPATVSVLDNYMVDLSEIAVEVSYAVVTAMVMVLFHAAYNIFIKQ